jgi:hypothetical protein
MSKKRALPKQAAGFIETMDCTASDLFGWAQRLRDGHQVYFRNGKFFLGPPGTPLS